VTITYDKYGKFLDDTKDEFVIEVREIRAPDGYLIDDPEWQEQTLRKGETLKDFVFTDTEYPEIEITKIDRETGKGPANTTFRKGKPGRVPGAADDGIKYFSPPANVRGDISGPQTKPSAAGSFGKGGARERMAFSPQGGNAVERTLRRRVPREWHFSWRKERLFARNRAPSDMQP